MLVMPPKTPRKGQFGDNGVRIDGSEEKEKVLECQKKAYRNVYGAIQQYTNDDARNYTHEEQKFMNGVKALFRGTFNSLEGVSDNLRLRHEEEKLFVTDLERLNLSENKFRIKVLARKRRSNPITGSLSNIQRVTQYLERDDVTLSGNRERDMMIVGGENKLRRVLLVPFEQAYEDLQNETISFGGTEPEFKISLSSFVKIAHESCPHIVEPNNTMMEESCCHFCYNIEGWYDALKNSTVYDVGDLPLNVFVRVGPEYWQAFS